MATTKSIAQIQLVVWVLIYGGLLTLVLGIAVARMDESLGWTMVGLGGVLAAIGAVLIVVRSRMKDNP